MLVSPSWDSEWLYFSFLIAHSFGRRMLYPGSVGLLQKAMRAALQQGQARLIEEVRKHALFRRHDSTGSKGTDFCWFTVWWPKEQVSGLWRQWDWHNVRWPEERWRTERPDPGKRKKKTSSLTHFKQRFYVLFCFCFLPQIHCVEPFTFRHRSSAVRGTQVSTRWDAWTRHWKVKYCQQSHKPPCELGVPSLNKCCWYRCLA